MQRHMVRRLSIIGILVGVTAITLMVSGMAAQVVTMIASLGQLRPSTIGIALLFSSLSALFSGLVWWRLIQRLGHTAPFRVALSAYLHAGLASYVVNFVGPALGSAVTLRRHGVGPGRAILLTLLANALGFIGILVWAPLGLVLLSNTGMDSTLPLVGRYVPAAVAGLIAALMVAMLLVVLALVATAGSGNRIARRLLGRGHAAEASTFPAPRYWHILSLVPYSALSWILGALALYVVLVEASHGATVSLGAVVGAAVIAAVLGSLAFFAPEGVGVKDGVLVALLTHATGLPLSTGVAAALAVRTLDPLTKLGLLGVLAVTANGAPLRLATGAAHSARQRLRLVVGKRRAAILGAGVFAAATILPGYRAFAYADKDITSTHRPTAVVAVLHTSPVHPFAQRVSQ